MKARTASSTHKKVVVALFRGDPEEGYLNPQRLGQPGEGEAIDLLTPDGEHKEVRARDVKAVYFVREFGQPFQPEKKAFLSRPKLEGLWVRLRFQDGDEMEGLVPNDLLDLLDVGVRLTPPDLHGNSTQVFIPRTALAEMKVLGVVGMAKRPPREKNAARAADGQAKLFGE